MHIIVQECLSESVCKVSCVLCDVQDLGLGFRILGFNEGRR
jgi:hypothetical protein